MIHTNDGGKPVKKKDDQITKPELENVIEKILENMRKMI